MELEDDAQFFFLKEGVAIGRCFNGTGQQTSIDVQHPWFPHGKIDSNSIFVFRDSLGANGGAGDWYTGGIIIDLV